MKSPIFAVPVSVVAGFLGALTLCVSMNVFAQPLDAGPDPDDEQLERLREARDEVFPALVSLHVVTSNFRDGKEFKSQSVGSGAIISRQGHVVTNEHVTRDGRRFDCVLSDQRRVSARLVGRIRSPTWRYCRSSCRRTS